MKLTIEQAKGFAKILKRGIEHYLVIPCSQGYFEEANDSGIVGYVVWKDEDANFTTGSGDTNQEFYIREDGVVCAYVKKVFVPVVWRAKNWRSFCSPKQKVVESAG